MPERIRFQPRRTVFVLLLLLLLFSSPLLPGTVCSAAGGTDEFRHRLSRRDRG